MRSLYDDIITTLDAHAFTIPNVVVRKPFDEGGKTYPMLVVHEIVNLPTSHSTVTGESTTATAYQIDILTQNCVDSSGNVLSRNDAGRRLFGEVNNLLDEQFKLTRRRVPPPDSPAPDVVRHIWRGEATLDSSGYSYRT